jgi:hypothetical protein
MNERKISDIVWKQRDPFGYGPEARRVRAFKWGDAAGTSDVVIFPKTGPAIAIVEVKRAVSDEANALVLGQLLKYYARALRMGLDGIHEIVAALEQRRQTQHGACSAAKLWRCSEAEANERCRRGRALGPGDVALHIVVDEAPTRMRLRLVRTCRALRDHHRLAVGLWRLNRSRDGIEPLSVPRTDEQGRAFAGSQRQIQIYVNRHTERLNRAICEAVPELRGLEQEIRWVSPLVAKQCREYRDAAALKALGLGPLTRRLSEFWPPGGPRWDALATVRLKDGQKGVLLVEAKSHAAEIEGGGAAATSKVSLRKILTALDETKGALSIDPGADWLGRHYQSANRLAHLHFFRARTSVPAWLVNIFFVDDPVPDRRTTREAWASKIIEVRRELGCPSDGVPWVADVILESWGEPWAFG